MGETMFIELEEMRVYRPFVGGKLLDTFCGDTNPQDNHYPERWICTTTEAGDHTGLSQTKDHETLRSLIHGELDILVKLLDSYTRLMIQVHPDKERAMKYYHYPHGKTECWYVLDTRKINNVDPYVFVGFKEGVTKKMWRDVFERQDIPAMENCLHRIPVQKGDTFFIKAGVPHAMGSGVFFCEVQEPSDITLRCEWKSPDNIPMKEFDLNYGGSFDTMFDCFDYDGANLEETKKRYMVPHSNHMIVDEKEFALMDIPITESYTLKPQNYAIVIVLEGPDKAKEFYLDEEHTFYGPGRILVCLGPKR